MLGLKGRKEVCTYFPAAYRRASYARPGDAESWSHTEGKLLSILWQNIIRVLYDIMVTADALVSSS